VGGKATDNSGRRCVPLAVGIQAEDGLIEYGVSFAGPNPEEKDYMPLKDAETAIKLVNLIQLMC